MRGSWLFGATLLGVATVGVATSGAVAVGGTLSVADAGWTYLPTAEIYDPMGEQFQPTGRMNAARESHVATLLADGRVLISGGHGGVRRSLRVFDSAEIYDPVSAQFTGTGTMTIRRHKHDAIRLENGQVLVLGGADERDSRGVYRSTELFDPRTGDFVPHVPMALPRYKFAGSTIPLDDGRFLITGGAGRPEVYEPLEAQFHPVATAEVMPGLFSASAPLPNGQVLISGGYGNPGAATADAWVFRTN